ncbi:MAG: UvrD-helicase domain-containing protein [Nitrospirae bacterium]|nr:UvrD-helicase domain-containing protein [Nitrospirota bacterium]
MDNYLDVNKSVVISSPAGSGKTEKLARRYIALLESGVEVERILAITFTERASAEMKQRILKILKEEDSALFRLLLEKMSLMRVSTIHSFCGTLLRRFSFEAATAPNYRIEDEIDALINWEAVLYEIIMEAGKGGDSHEMLLQTLGEKGFRGLEHLKTAINKLFAKRPSSLEAEIPAHSADISLEDELIKWPGAGESIENYISLFKNDAFNKLVSAEKLFLTDSRMPRKRTPSSLKNIRNYQDWAIKMSLYWRERNIEEHMKRGERIMAVFSKCLARYSDHRQADRGVAVRHRRQEGRGDNPDNIPCRR